MHGTTSLKFIVLYILIFKFLDSNLEDKRFCTEWLQALPDLNLTVNVDRGPIIFNVLSSSLQIKSESSPEKQILPETKPNKYAFFFSEKIILR